MRYSNFHNRVYLRRHALVVSGTLVLPVFWMLGGWVESCAGGTPELPNWMHVPCQTDPGAVGWNEPLDRPRGGFETNVWWGKPLNPSEFWKGRTVWLDVQCFTALRQRGRTRPPPAFDDAFLSLSNYCAWVADGSPKALTNICEAECNWWDRWTGLLPRTPDDIAWWHARQAQEYMSRKASPEAAAGDTRSALLKRATSELEDWQNRMAERALSEGWPLEALDDQALYWAYVRAKRIAYAEECGIAKRIEDEERKLAFLAKFRESLSVDFDVVGRPVTEAENKLADEWKRRYVRRLVREETDRTYIESYCTTWGLDAKSLVAEALQEAKANSREDLVPKYLKGRSPARLTEHQQMVVPILARGDVQMARAMATRYCLDWDKLTELAEQAKREADKRREQEAALTPEQITAWRKQCLIGIIGVDEKEAEAKAKEWGINIEEIRKARRKERGGQ